jgi:protein TonB
MFADSLLDSHGANRSHRGWTTLASFALQTLAVGMVLALPLITSESLPRVRSTIVASFGPPPGQRTATGHHLSSDPAHRSVGRGFTTPPQVPLGLERGPDIPIPDLDAGPNGVPGGTGPAGALNPVFGSTGIRLPPVPPPSPPPSAPPPPVSVMMEGNLIYKVQPVYPAMARAARVQGAVVLRAMVSKSGTIENLQVVSGHPLLVKAASDAVRQWLYRPYVLNRQPVEVETQVTVNFILSGG